jgi:hypothetical protein
MEYSYIEMASFFPSKSYKCIADIIIKMKGIYVLDLDNGHFFIACAQSLQDAQCLLTVLTDAGAGAGGFDGSYHYYPIAAGETDHDAEKRIFIQIAKREGLEVVVVRAELRDSLGKGTWCSEFQSHLKKLLTDESSSPALSAGKDGVFSISI